MHGSSADGDDKTEYDQLLKPRRNTVFTVRNLPEAERQSGALPTALDAAEACQQQDQEMMEGTCGRSGYAEPILRITVHFRGIQERSQARSFTLFFLFFNE